MQTVLSPELRRLFDTIAADAQTRQRPEYLQERWPPYCCFGCLKAEFSNPSRKALKPATVTRYLTGDERAEVLKMLLLPSVRKALMLELGYWLIPWAYFAQAYEAGVSGPGAVLGWYPASLHEPEISVAQGLQFWLWQSRETYLPVAQMGDDGQICQHLWSLMQARCGQGLAWLAQKQNYAHVNLTAEVREDIYTLLGVPPLQRVVTQQLGRNWQLTGPETIEVRG